jgi:UDP-glucose 4-epimerase
VEMLYRDVSRETINIGPDEQDVSVMDLAKELADIIGFRLDPVFLPGRPLEVKNAVCSSEKARRLLGYETTTTFRQGLESIVEWIRENGTRPFRYHLPVEIATEATPRTWTERLF